MRRFRGLFLLLIIFVLSACHTTGLQYDFGENEPSPGATATMGVTNGSARSTSGEYTLYHSVGSTFAATYQESGDGVYQSY